jgi:hypothetical protein
MRRLCRSNSGSSGPKFRGDFARCYTLAAFEVFRQSQHAFVGMPQSFCYAMAFGCG